VIIRLAAPQTTLSHVDIDTSHFSGNECPISQIFALKLSDEEVAASAPAAVTDKTKLKSKSKSKPLKLSPNDPRWTEVLPQVTLGPNSRHIFELDSRGKEGVWSAVLVRMIPDGGMVRCATFVILGSMVVRCHGTALIAGSIPSLRFAAGAYASQSSSRPRRSANQPPLPAPLCSHCGLLRRQFLAAGQLAPAGTGPRYVGRVGDEAEPGEPGKVRPWREAAWAGEVRVGGGAAGGHREHRVCRGGHGVSPGQLPRRECWLL